MAFIEAHFLLMTEARLFPSLAKLGKNSETTKGSDGNGHAPFFAKADPLVEIGEVYADCVWRTGVVVVI